MAKQDRRIGLIGWGRLSRALSRRLEMIEGLSAVVWSRGFRHEEPTVLGCRTTWVANISDVLVERVVVSAIASEHLLRLAAGNMELREYHGNLLVAGIDKRLDEISSVFRRARIVRFAPFLTPGGRSIPCLTLLDQRSTRESSAEYMDILTEIGDQSYVRDERLFDFALLFGSPLPAVLNAALEGAARDALRHRGLPEDATELVSGLIRQFLGSHNKGRELYGHHDIATPGGLTEAGMRHVDAVVSAISDVVESMISHQGRKQ